MAHGSREQKTLRAKVVYYGPASGGKTTNLEVLHRIADARAGHELVTVKTRHESTLFFDLLPFQIEDVLGKQVTLNLFTVPGQVRYDATRRVVLAGADAIVFVADSRSSRREQNVWSLQDLRMNMRAKKIDPRRVPILFQANKRDLPDAASAAEVAEWLGVQERDVILAVAMRGEGVVETLRAAGRAALLNLLDRPDAGALALALDRVLAPLSRAILPQCADGSDEPPRTPIVLPDGDLLEGAIATSVWLGEGQTVATARARRLAREADGFRRLGESLCEIGAGDPEPGVALTALEVARDVLGAAAVSLIHATAAGPLVAEGTLGCDEDPLLGCGSGRELLRRLLAADGSCVVDDASEHFSQASAAGIRSVAAVPVGREGQRVLVAYGAQAAAAFEPPDVRFLGSVARHLGAALERARACQDLALHRQRLEDTVVPREPNRSRTRGSRRAVDRVRERLLGNLSDEMRAPLAAIASAAAALKEGGTNEDACRELAASIAASTTLLGRQLDDLARLSGISGGEPLRLAEVTPDRLLEAAIRLAGHPGVCGKVGRVPGPCRVDLDLLARAIANLIDNAVKFSPPAAPVRVRLAAGRLADHEGAVPALVVSVLDRGPGVPEEDRERIFAPFATAGPTPGGARKGKGMGIGLYEARCLAARHGGHLECASRPGGGSEFRLVVPLQPIAAHAALEVTRV